MRHRWRKRAVDEFRHIRRYIAERNPAAAERVISDIQRAADRLLDFPGLGHLGEYTGVLELQVPRRPYVLIYRIDGDVIEILSIFDQRRDPENMI